MDKQYYIANWKSNKTESEVEVFFSYLHEHLRTVSLENKELIVAPPFSLLSKCRDLIKKYSLPIELAAQNVSSFPEGAYTGEVNAKQVKEYAKFVIIGHSERKKYQHETESEIENKISESNDQHLTVIQCIQDERSQIHKGASIIAYEPPSAISTFGVGEPESAEDIREVFRSLNGRLNGRPILYGGSVNAGNILEYNKIEICNGYLIGGSSLKPDSFISLLS